MNLKAFVGQHGQTGAAKLLGVTQGRVWQWLNGDRIPAERAVEFEQLTEGALTRHELRPDLFAPAEDSIQQVS